MASKQQIQNAFVNELLNTDEYQTVSQLKQYILNQINVPNIQEIIVYSFEEAQTTEQLNNIKLCIQFEFGFIVNNDDINANSVSIDMKKFL